MTLEKAIASLTYMNATNHSFFTEESHEATRLGIEALTRIQQLREIYISQPAVLLPSETKE